jgi:DNA-binding transcriptional regulator YiaG
MTPDELWAALDTLGWSKQELGRRLGVHRNTVTGWNEKVPGYVAAYVGLALKVKELSREI